LFAVFYLAMTFAVIYFNSPLVAAAYDYMRGGKPTVSSALAAANEHLPSIFRWSCFSTTIALILDQLPHGDNRVLNIVGPLVVAMDSIFRAALYQYAATGEAPGMFPPHVRRNAYVEKGNRGGWGGPSASDYHNTPRSRDYGDTGTRDWGAPR